MNGYSKSILNWIWSLSLQAHLGTLHHIKRHAEDKIKKTTIEEAINAFKERWPDVISTCNSEPIFIFSAGWRSGSTLLQRLLMSSQKIMIWGEPYSQNCLIDNLSKPLKGITKNIPKDSYFITERIGNQTTLVDQFIANLYPEINYLIDAHTGFILKLFEQPAKDKGIARWGIKEVRLTIDHAIYLNWLFPKSKFIFLYRNPYQAYNSYKGFYWYKKWPNEPVYKPDQFGKHWSNLLQGYINGHQKLDSRLLSYEDLCSENYDFDDLEDFLGFNVDKKVMKLKIGNDGDKKKENKISLREMRILKRVVEPLASELGYVPSTAARN